jgi:hypothetical protein
VVGDRRLREVEQRDQLANADLAGVLAEDIDELHPDRVAECFRHFSQTLGLLALDIGINDRLATRLAGGSLGLGGQLQIDSHLFTYIY